MNKNIVLGITGGIAAYKMVEVASRLKKLGHHVNVVMTEAATRFVAPLTFQSITHNPVETDLFTPPLHYDVKHISLAEKADLFLIAPATANFIGKMAHGIADDLLSTMVMATEAPVLIAPAMNVHMYNNPILKDNLNYLKNRGYDIITPGSGYLACGDIGAGRLPEPVELVEEIIKKMTVKDLKGKKFLVSAGPTREALDPVRFLSNYSSGKMGYALARMAKYRGAEVILVSGPTELNSPSGVYRIMVENAREMEKEIKRLAPEQDIIIMAAAVADYRPVKRAEQKIKKRGQENLILEFEKNQDILDGLGREKKTGQLLIGFAAESENLLKNAKEKLSAKNLDMIICNDISKPGIGFQSDHNQVTIINNEREIELPLKDKNKLADIIINYIIQLETQ